MTASSYKDSLLNKKVKRHYVPATKFHGFWWVRSARTVVTEGRGFIFYRLDTDPPTYYISRGNHIWKEVSSL
jgi:hypothetical protein